MTRVRFPSGAEGASGEGLCGECQELLAYALRRIEKCPYEEEKPPCADCPIHCYQPERREQVKRVMRYAGPRMTLRHPWLAMMHMLDGLRGVPGMPKKLAARSHDGRPAAAPTRREGEAGGDCCGAGDGGPVTGSGPDRR